VFPVLFQIGPFTVYSFGVLMALGFYVGATVSAREYERRGGDRERMWNFLVWVFIAGLAGSKLLSLANDPAAFFRDPIEQTLSGSGFVWYGGLIGGFVAAWFLSRSYHMRFPLILECTALGLAVGQAIGRIGCFLVGDDYGRATDLPWGVAFPEGLPPVDYPVHPTMLYETLWLLLVAGLLWQRRKRSPSLMGEYLMLNGLGRAVIEHWRLNARVALELSEAQWIGIALIVFGAVLILRGRTVRAAA
jgi:phosphatidylglycerol:prolipoprotein diacylglycerol transferase